MPLPDILEVEPIQRPIRAAVSVPGSKSITNRALILAALSSGQTVLKGALWSEDTQVMVECLRQLGFAVDVQPDLAEPGNRVITVQGQGGRIPRRGPLNLFVGNAGTAARFLAALVCLGEGSFRLHGVARMHERPQAELFAALRALGYTVLSEAQNEKLPAVITGGGSAARPRRSATVSIQSSSQFASALLLCARTGNWDIEISGSNGEEAGYVTMTRGLLDVFPAAGGTYPIEADASSASYFVAADHLLAPVSGQPHAVTVSNWPASSWQIDTRFPQVLAAHPHLAGGLALARGGRAVAPGELIESAISRQQDLGDSIMMAIVLASLAAGPVRFTDLGRLRVQECERVQALRTELERCGARVEEIGDALTVYPAPLRDADIETYNDHRMAMCFAILGLKVPGVRLKNPACVKKTFPNFFQKLTDPTPGGLGAVLRDGHTGRTLASDELFAD